MDRYTVFSDAECDFCVRIKGLLAAWPPHLPVGYVAARSREGEARCRGIAELGRELVVAHDDGRAWVGPRAFVVVLSLCWGFRLLAWVLAEGPLRPLTLALFGWISKNRGALASVFGAHCRSGACSVATPYR